MFIARLKGVRVYRKKKLGKVTPCFDKCMYGCGNLTIFAIFILGPFLIFSDIKGLTSSNLVVDGKIDLSIRINSTQYEFDEFGIFEMPHSYQTY